MTHWMDSGSFTDDSDIDAPPLKAWDPAIILAAQLASRFPHPLPRVLLADGACIDTDPSVFDPTETAEELAELGQAAPSSRDSAQRQQQAARVCAGCPVRAECLADARANTETVGIRGGVLFAAGVGGRVRAEHNLIDLLRRGLLSDSPAGRGKTAASTAA